MKQLIPRVQNHVSYGAANTYWQVNSGTLDDSATFGPVVSLIPVPWATTVRNLSLLSYDTTRPYDIVATLRKNNVDTALTGTLLASENGPVHIPGIDISYAQFDDFSYHASTPFAGPPLGQTIGWCVEAESVGNIFGVSGGGGSSCLVGSGNMAGALGNGFWNSYVHGVSTQASSYSICATPGTLTTVVVKGYASIFTPNIPIPGGSSYIVLILLNGVVQDGSGGTVDTRTTIPAGFDVGSTVVGTFSLPLVKGDHVDIAYYRTGANAAYEEPAFGIGIGFMPTTDGYFMLTGGSNNVVYSPGLGYVWIRAEQNVTVEGLAQAPLGPAGLTARGLYVERGGGGSGPTYTRITTLRRTGVSTPIVVTLLDFATSGFVEGFAEVFTTDDLISLESDTQVDARLRWGLEASIEEDVPTFGTLVVTKDAGGDLATPFTIEVGGGLSPASPALVGGDSQVYADVPTGSGYSVAEPVVPDGWQLTGITVSNGSDPDNISIGDGETVTVTVANAQVITPCVGELEGARVDGLPYRPVSAVPTGALTINGEVITINGIPITVS